MVNNYDLQLRVFSTC